MKAVIERKPEIKQSGLNLIQTHDHLITSPVSD